MPIINTAPTNNSSKQKCLWASIPKQKLFLWHNQLFKLYSATIEQFKNYKTLSFFLIQILYGSGSKFPFIKMLNNCLEINLNN